MRLTTASTHPRVGRLRRHGGESFAAAVVRRFWPMGLPYIPPREVFGGVTVPAVVNHGRWIVRCPFCPGAQLADEADSRFFCVDCLHAGTAAEGRWLEVEWPTDAAGVEEVLGRRAVRFRNWELGESLDDLVAENLERGVGA